MYGGILAVTKGDTSSFLDYIAHVGLTPQLLEDIARFLKLRTSPLACPCLPKASEAASNVGANRPKWSPKFPHFSYYMQG